MPDRYEEEAGDDRRMFAKAYSLMLEKSRSGEGADNLLPTLLRTYRKAWHSGDDNSRQDVLHFVGRYAVIDALDLVWDGLQSSNNRVIGGALAVLTAVPKSDLVGLRQDEVRRLQGIASDRESPFRTVALDVLDRFDAGGLDDWLRALGAEDADEDVRFAANRMLLKTGDQPAKEALFDHLGAHPEHHGYALHLWSYRHGLRLTPEEVRELEDNLHVYVAKVCDMMQDTESANRPPVKVVGALARDGLELRAGVIDEIAAYARAAPEAKYRLEAVDALAAIGKPRARELLEELAAAGEPADAAERARQLLRGDGP